MEKECWVVFGMIGSSVCWMLLTESEKRANAHFAAILERLAAVEIDEEGPMSKAAYKVRPNERV